MISCGLYFEIVGPYIDFYLFISKLNDLSEQELFSPGSLHQGRREKQQEKIAEENARLARNLQAVKPIYTSDTWVSLVLHHNCLCLHVAGSNECALNRIMGIPVNTEHLYSICPMLDQRRRRWADVVQMLCKCFVFAGIFMMKVRNLVSNTVGFGCIGLI